MSVSDVTSSGVRGDPSSIARLLLRLRRREVTGSVQVWELGTKSTVIYLRAGQLVHVERSDALDRLGQLLVEEGILAGKAIDRALAQHKETGRLLGDVLCQLGLVEPAKLRDLLQLQISRRLTRIFTATANMIEVADGEHPFGRSDGAPGVTVETRSLIYPGIRGSYDDARIVRELRPFLGRELHLKPISPKLLDEASFKAPEYAVLQVLAGEGIRVDEVWLSSAARDAKAVVLALWYLDMLDTFEIPPALMRTPTPAPVVTGAVPQQAAPSSDTSKRIVLDNTPGKMSSSEWAALGAGQTMKVAEGFYRGGDLGRAERAFEAALMAEPQNPRALAFLTWIRLTKAGGSRNTAVNDAMKIFQESVRADQNFGYGYYFMGELLQLRGDGENAEKAFKNAIRVAPDLFEADRQLRLIAMRRKSGRRS